MYSRNTHNSIIYFLDFLLPPNISSFFNVIDKSSLPPCC